ncbi:unnamed protein product [Vicia faba]|uniref:Uncharacterized protein n=1 Tax=Vicia faba TaxID=3906 RepID=A0AAV1A7I3_VICFA|nr:unnamed protein product [Vicia faba]
MKDCGDNGGREFQDKYYELLKVMKEIRIDPEDELSKLMTDFKILRIDTREKEEEVVVEEQFKKFTDIKLKVNKMHKLYEDLKLLFNSLSPNDELYQGVLDIINYFESKMYQGIFDSISELEFMFQLIFDNFEKKN